MAAPETRQNTNMLQHSNSNIKLFLSMSVQSLSATVNNVLNYWMDGSYPGCGKCDIVNSPDPWFIFYYLKIQKCYQILYLRKLFIGLNSMLNSTDILSSGYKLICSGCRWHLINSIQLIFHHYSCIYSNVYYNINTDTWG